jgi:hypothetical protein
MSYARYFILILVLVCMQSCGVVDRSLKDKDMKDTIVATPPLYTEKNIRVIIEQVDITDLLFNKLIYKNSMRLMGLNKKDYNPFPLAFNYGFNNVFTVVESGEAYDLIITPEVVDYKLNILSEKYSYDDTTWTCDGTYNAEIVCRLTVTDSNKKKIAEISKTATSQTVSSWGLGFNKDKKQAASSAYYKACSEANHELAKYLVPLMVNDLLDNNGFRVYAEEKKVK